MIHEMAYEFDVSQHVFIPAKKQEDIKYFFIMSENEVQRHEDQTKRPSYDYLESCNIFEE